MNGKSKRDEPVYQVEYRQSEAARQLDPAQISLTLWRIYQMALERAHECKVNETSADEVRTQKVDEVGEPGELTRPTPETAPEQAASPKGLEVGDQDSFNAGGGMLAEAYDAFVADNTSNSEQPGGKGGHAA